MVNTPNLNLPLLSPSQAQKHVTVNEALTLIDLSTNTVVEDIALTEPPVTPIEGQNYIVASGATGDWEGCDAKIARFSNGGWIFASPREGWQAFDKAETKITCFDGTGWVNGALSVTSGGGGCGFTVVELDHALTAGPSNTTQAVIPSHSVVIGVSARVIGPITGTLSSWSLGVAGSSDRYGTGYGTALNSYAKGLTGSPVTYWGDTELLLSAEGGDFAGGQIRLVVHCLEIIPPRAV